jgi:D-alanyl-D-alanine carboxypeptidase/D-alanyl-D-alanine endopeptidase (penicillin-binding protein 7)
MRRALLLLLLFLFACTPGWAELSFASAHAIVVDEQSGEVLLQKDEASAAPIASLTKLMTAMVVLDAQQDPREGLRISTDDLDRLKGTHGGVPVGAVVSRGDLLTLALMASDNHAASALARHYPGGMLAFDAAVRRKIDTLGLASTVIEEPTGLSPNNRSSAQDIAKLLHAAAAYPQIASITSQRKVSVPVNGRRWTVKNTNALVGAPGWNILASKTGFTNEAGRCVSMRVQAAGRTVMVVLMGALRSSERALDALNVRRWLAGEAPLPVLPGERKTRRMASAARHAPAAEVSPPQQGSDAADSSAPAATEPASEAEPDAAQSVK